MIVYLILSSFENYNINIYIQYFNYKNKKFYLKIKIIKSNNLIYDLYKIIYF